MKHRLAVIVGIIAIVVIALGAYLTGETRVLPGTNGTPGSDPGIEHIHRIGGYVVAALSVGLGIWVMNPAGWCTVIVAIGEAVTRGIPVLHAILSPMLLACIAAVAVTTSQRWLAGPQTVLSPWKPLRALGMFIPVYALVQVALGAAARHNFMNPIIHVLNAFLVIAVFMVPGVFVLRQYPEHPSLKPAALAALIIVGIQVLLGFAVYLVLLMSEANNMGLIIMGVLHVVNGALTYAAAVVLAMEMTRQISKA